MRFYQIILVCVFILLNGTKISAQPQKAVLKKEEIVKKYIDKGDSIYARKNSLKAFEQSNIYYDSAYYIALNIKDTLLIAEAIFAKARVYDAWNKEPQKTIKYLFEANRLFNKSLKEPQKSRQDLYIRHLIAHAYEKASDSANCCKTIQKICFDYLKLNKEQKKRMFFMSQLALIASEVNNFKLADEVLKQYVDMSLVKNNPDIYNFRDLYQLTQARIDVYYYKNKNTPFLDSVHVLFEKSKNLGDSAYYCNQLQKLYSKLGNYEKAYDYLLKSNQYTNRMTDKNLLEVMENKLLISEVEIVKREKEIGEINHKNRVHIIWGLGGLLVVIGLLSLNLFRKNKVNLQQAKELGVLNASLMQKNHQNELLTKELHHRTKNNLQMILGLLQMQERNTENQEVKAQLFEARCRIENIANLHEQLLHQAFEVDFHKYISDLVQTIKNGSFSSKKMDIQLVINENCIVPYEKILPISLILNEWVMNSIKYADCKDMLNIRIQVFQNADKINLHYNDSGAAKRTFTPGLGTEIVSLFCQQLHANLKRNTENVFDYNLTIPNAK